MRYFGYDSVSAPCFTRSRRYTRPAYFDRFLAGKGCQSILVEFCTGKWATQFWSKPGRESGGFNFGQNLGGKVGGFNFGFTMGGKVGASVWGADRTKDEWLESVPLSRRRIIQHHQGRHSGHNTTSSACASPVIYIPSSDRNP